VVWHAEKPILRSAPAPLYLLSKLVRESGYKVVLTGEGSDEIFGGYDLYKEAKIRRFCAAQPDSRLRPLLLKRLYPYLPGIQAQSTAYLRASFGADADSLASPFFSHLPRWQLTSKLKLFYSDELKSALGAADPYAQLRGQLPEDYASWDAFCQAQYLESTGLLPGYILSSQGDRVAMANAVEGRFPFLDHRVVELARSIPPRLKMRALNEKYILKRVARGLVPAEVLKRPKQPYRAPDARSFLGAGEPEYVKALLDPEQLRRDGLFNPNAVQVLVAKVRDSLRRGRGVGAKENMALMGILSTQLIANRFIERLAEATES
jgi:asparagine synthase (glutamine-hydrolysing)